MPSVVLGLLVMALASVLTKKSHMFTKSLLTLAMVAAMSVSMSGAFAHPAQWAPLVLVGEGNTDWEKQEWHANIPASAGPIAQLALVDLEYVRQPVDAPAHRHFVVVARNNVLAAQRPALPRDCFVAFGSSH
jgi:hypothetical protein